MLKNLQILSQRNQVLLDQNQPAADSTPSSPTVTSAPASKPTREVSDEFVLTPAARHMSQSKNLDATVLEGTGKGGRVTKGDVILALKEGIQMPPWKAAGTAEAISSAPAVAAATPVAPAPVPTTPTDVQIPSITTSGTYTDIPNSNMRKIIAKRLTESKATVPHFYSTVEIELDEILALRKKLVKDHDVKVSVNDIILKASAMALRDVPEVNSALSKGSSTTHVSVSPTVDISVAVATPSGLITPIVTNTDTLGLVEISNKIKDLATRARDGKLAPEEFQGGSFCISNLGMFGITEFSAVINPPQAAILAVGGGVSRVLVNSPWVDGVAKEDQVKPTVKTVMTARLSADRRVVDEPTVGLFLRALRHYLNKPELLLL
jgi:pyruvate dehydrogenase E2 component (dihydrolipoamide acetyltransferase)